MCLSLPLDRIWRLPSLIIFRRCIPDTSVRMFLHILKACHLISRLSPVYLGLQRNENRLQWDGRLSRPAPGLNLDEQASVFISTVWLTVAVSCVRRGGFTDLAAVCRDTELPPPLLHSVQSTQLIGGTGPPRSLSVSE